MAKEAQEWFRTAHHLHVRWWKPWCLTTSFSRSKLRWIRDARVCLHASYCSELHGCFCISAPQGCKLSRAASQTSYFYLFVLNTHGWPWKAFTDTSKCTRIWSRLMSPDVQTTSLQLMFLPEVKQNLITALLTLLSLSIILKRIVFLSPSLKVFKIIKYDLKLFWF